MQNPLSISSSMSLVSEDQRLNNSYAKSLQITTANLTDGQQLEALISPPYTPLLPAQVLWDPKTSLCSNDRVIFEQEQSSTPFPSAPFVPLHQIKKAPSNSFNSIKVDNAIDLENLLTFPAVNRKRKGSLPHRAISPPRDQVDRSFQRIVNLDVYTAFKTNPANLLNRRKSSSSNHESDSDSVSSRKSPVLACSTISSVNASSIKKNSGNQSHQSACKVLPSFIKEKEPNNMRLDAYKNTIGAPPVSWKGAQPLNITTDMVNFDELTSEEVRTCATLRILPNQYLEIKKTLLTAVETYGPFKKREAQTWFRIDVNKICIIYDWFKTLGWIPNTEEWAGNGDVAKKPSHVDQKKKVKRR